MRSLIVCVTTLFLAFALTMSFVPAPTQATAGNRSLMVIDTHYKPCRIFHWVCKTH